MSAIALDTRLEPYFSPRPAFRPLAHSVPLDDAATPVNEFQPWELHSELVFVDPELRRRSLELLPEPTDVLAARPRPPLEVVVPALEPAPETVGLLRYTAQRVADLTRLGLAIVGTVFTLAMIAEVVPH